MRGKGPASHLLAGLFIYCAFANKVFFLFIYERGNISKNLHTKLAYRCYLCNDFTLEKFKNMVRFLFLNFPVLVL